MAKKRRSEAGRKRRPPQVKQQTAGRGRRRVRPARRWAWILGTVALAASLALGGLYLVGKLAPARTRLTLEIPPGSDALAVTELLDQAGALEHPRLFALYLRVFFPWVRFEPGPHLISEASSLQTLVTILGRSRGRPIVRVSLPEGFNLFQIAQRVDDSGVCPADSFQAAARDAEALGQLGVSATSAEGYLFPATYEFRRNTPAERVVHALVAEARRRYDAALAEHSAAVAKLHAELGWGLHEIVTLASVVEKETALPDERGTVASVFLNRLRDPDFRPRQRLQSDPTALYGCLLEPTRAVSCGGFGARVTPAMLRDAANRYNTYTHPGLPPGPICNPSLSALAAVLSAPPTDYLFFVADGHGGHVFTRTLQEHQAAIDSAK